MKKHGMYRLGALLLATALLTSLFGMGGIPVSAEETEVIVYTSPKPSTIAKTGIGNVWNYEYATDKGTDFTAMKRDAGAVFYKDGKEGEDINLHARVERPFETDCLYLVPGSTGTDAVIAFTAQYDGVIDIASAEMTRNYGMEAADIPDSDVQIAVFKNTEKIWPAGEEWQSIGWTYTMPAIEDIAVEKGDILRFVVNYGDASYSNWCDYTDWPVTISHSVSKPAAGATLVYNAPTYENRDEVDIGNRWLYEYSTGKNTDFTPMALGEGGANAVEFVSDAAEQTEGASVRTPWPTQMFLVPGYNDAGSINAVLTFDVPYDGKLTVDAAEVIRNYGEGTEDIPTSSVEIAIYKNTEKIWPADDWAAITQSLTPVNTLTVPEITDLEVKAQDKIRFVVGCGEADTVNWKDYTQWTPTLTLETAAEEAGIPDISGITPTQYRSPTPETWDQCGIGTLWIYEYATNKGTNFKPMVPAENAGSKLFLSDLDGAIFQASVDNPWGHTIYFAPGYVDSTMIDAALTYVAPCEGVLKINPATVERNYGEADSSNIDSDADIAIFVNEKKIWPSGSGWQNIRNDSSPINQVQVPAIENIVLSEGDKVRFVVNCGNSTYANWCDYIDWPVDLSFYITDENYTPPKPTPGPTTTTAATAKPTSPGTGEPGTTSVAFVPVLIGAGALVFLAGRRYRRKA